MNLGLGLGLGLTLAGGGSSAPTLPSGLVQRLMSWDVPVQADNTDITTLTDITGGHVYTVQSAGKPKYRTAGLGGMPYFQVTNGQYATASQSDGPGTALKAVFASGEYTIISFVADIGTGTQSNGTYWGTYDGSTIFGLRSGSTGICGSFQSLRAGVGNFQANTTGPVMVAQTSTKTYPYGNSPTVVSLSRVYVNGTCIGSGSTAGPVSAADFGLFALQNGNAGWSFGGKGYGHLIFDRCLSPAEIKQCYKWFNSQTGQANPWDSSPIYLLFGNSLDNGQAATAPAYTPMAIVAATNSLGLGTWDNLGVSGQDTQGMLRAISEVTDIGKVTGAVVKVVIGEWYNSRYNSPIITPAQILANFASMVGSIKSALPTSKVAIETMPSSDADNTNSFADYDTFVSGVVSGYAGWGADAVARVDQNANIGRAGTLTNTTYFQTDHIHLTGVSGACGYAEKAAVLAPVFAAL